MCIKKVAQDGAARRIAEARCNESELLGAEFMFKGFEYKTVKPAEYLEVCPG